MLTAPPAASWRTRTNGSISPRATAASTVKLLFRVCFCFFPTALLLKMKFNSFDSSYWFRCGDAFLERATIGHRSIRRPPIGEEMRHKPVHGRRHSLSNLMHVCESCCQHVGRKSQKIIFKAAGDSGSPGSCASLKHSNKMLWKMDLRLHTSAGTA